MSRGESDGLRISLRAVQTGIGVLGSNVNSIWMQPAGQDVFPSEPFLEMAQQLEQKS